MERRTHLLIALLALCGASCARFMHLEDPDRILHSHAAHLERGATCLDCHADVDRANDALRSFLPAHEECARCHQPKMNACEECHTDPSRAALSPPSDRGLVFSHVQHLDRVNGNCMRCHDEIPRAKTIEESRVPEMESCTDGCHKEDLSSARCKTCHVDLGRYRLEAIQFMAHPTSFEKKHQQAAKENAKTCNTCHERTFCTDCHAGASVLGAEEKAAERATRSFIHPAPYRSIHALDARTNSNTCSTCHPSSFCSSCHASLGLASLESLRGTGGPHPQEWLDPMSPAFHGREARRSIASCASCHDQGARSVCVRCHQVGGTGGSPHPPGFERRAAPRDNRMCRVCHIR